MFETGLHWISENLLSQLLSMASLEEEGVQVLTYWYVYDEPLEMILHCNQKKTIYRFNVVTVTDLF
jgi:hypothetical protein